MYEEYKQDLLNSLIFEKIEEQELMSILTCLKPRIKTFNKDEIIVIENDQYEGLGIILSGEVLVTKENEVGERHVIAKLKKGRNFGEMVAFSNMKKWPATVIAQTSCVIMFMAPETIITNCCNLCSGHHQLMQNFLRIVSHKALYLNRKMEYLSIKSMRGKIAKYIVETFKQNQKVIFDLPLNRNELADFLNVSRPSMSRELARMKDEGIIDFHKSSFKILALDKLNEAAAHLN
jgi:CRP-like cAMP-binding protein